MIDTPSVPSTVSCSGRGCSSATIGEQAFVKKIAHDEQVYTASSHGKDVIQKSCVVESSEDVPSHDRAATDKALLLGMVHLLGPTILMLSVSRIRIWSLPTHACRCVFSPLMKVYLVSSHPPTSDTWHIL